jgi:alkanesulfonate monooxygenase SsuD/methylene tetrahydromethanopterin reductase-like flavin-dependent oxidoreductase (luciferase family)
MRIGVIVLQTQPWSRLQQTFRDLEDMGADVAYVADHLTHPTLVGEWIGDPWATLAAAATVTDRIELGTLVASASFGSPARLARSSSTVQDVSGGRLVLGLGSGSPHCAAADRAEHPTPRQLTDRFVDVVEGLTHIWAGDEAWQGAVLGYEGRQGEAFVAGSGRPFLVLAAHGRRTQELAVRHADGWSTYGGAAGTALEPADYWALVAEQSRDLTAACERAGRTAPLRRSLLLGYGTVKPLGSTSAFEECLERTEEAGFDEVVVYWPHGEPGTRWAFDPDVLAAGLDRNARRRVS